MDVKTAVRLGVDYARNIFSNEPISLEEVWYDEGEKEWCVTVGVIRAEPGLLAGQTVNRLRYKTVRIGEADSSIKSIRNRDEFAVAR